MLKDKLGGLFYMLLNHTDKLILEEIKGSLISTLELSEEQQS